MYWPQAAEAASDPPLEAALVPLPAGPWMLYCDAQIDARGALPTRQ